MAGDLVRLTLTDGVIQVAGVLVDLLPMPGVLIDLRLLAGARNGQALEKQHFHLISYQGHSRSRK